MADAPPADAFIVLPYRRGDVSDPDWRLCMHYLSATSPSSCNSTVEDAFRTMASYHESVVRTCQLSPDSQFTISEKFIDYTALRYCQLIAMAQAHLPLNSGQVNAKLKYVWRDSLIDGLRYESMNSNAELTSCIYNIAACYNNLGVQGVQRGGVEEISQAYANFQKAAGYYTMLMEELSVRIPPEQRDQGDLAPTSLRLLQRMALAHAHHSGYLKASINMADRHDTLAKLAAEGAKVYDEVRALFKGSTWSAAATKKAKEVELHLSAAVVVFRARACLHRAAQRESESAMGEAIAYLKVAREQLGKLPKMPTNALIAWVNEVITRVNETSAKAEKTNAAVFFDRVPAEVPPVEGLPRPLGQAATPASVVMAESTRASDPFFGITPAHVADYARTWRAEQQQRVDACINAAAQGRASISQGLAQLGAVAATEHVGGELDARDRIPGPLRARLVRCQDEAGGRPTDKLAELLSEGETMQQRAADATQRVEQLFQQLATEEQGYITTYGERMWFSLMQAYHTTPDYGVLHQHLQEAKQGMQTSVEDPMAQVKRRISTQLQSLARLSWKMADLDALMPYSRSAEAQDGAAKTQALINQLKELLASKDALEKQQLNAEASLKELLGSDAITTSLSAAESADRQMVLARATQSITDAMEKVNAPLREERELNGRAEALMESLTVAQSADPVVAEIEQLTNNLSCACDVYEESVRSLSGCHQAATAVLMSLEEVEAATQAFVSKRKAAATDAQRRLDASIEAKMQHMQATQGDIDASQRRQQDLRAQIASLEQQKQPQQQPGFQSYGPPPMQQPTYQQPTPVSYNYSAPGYGMPQQQQPQQPNYGGYPNYTYPHA